MTQLVVRIDARLAAAIDGLVSDGVVENRSEAVRLALQKLVDQHRRDQLAHSIVEAYQRLPQSQTEVGWADEATRRMIVEEAW